MGQEIVYCFWCSTKIMGADFDKGAAVLIGNHACCPQCLPKVMASLPDKQRETLLAELSRSAEPKPPGRNTPRGGNEISSSKTPRSTATLPASPAPAKSPTLLLAAVGGVAVAGAMLLLLVGGGKKEAPEPRPVDPPLVSKPEVPEREKAARAAIQKARDAAKSGIDIDLQVRLWEDAVAKSERTPCFDEATQERAQILVRRREVYDQELARLMDSVDGIVRDDEFKKALDALASARKRHESPDWGPLIDRKVDEVRKMEADGVPYRQEGEGLVCVEAERCHRKVGFGEHNWTLVTAPAGFSGAGAMAALPNKGTGWLKDIETTSPRMDFRIRFQKPGKYYLWFRGYADGGTDDSLHAGLDGKETKSAFAVALSGNKKWNWTTKIAGGPASFVEVPTAGVHVLNLWMREDGAIIDKVVLTPDPKYAPKELGPPESSR